MSSSTLRLVVTAGAAALLAPAIGSLAGCNIVAPVAFLVQGEPEREAQFLLNKDLPTVIFVDDRSNRIPFANNSVRREIAGTATETLLGAEALLTVISPGDAIGAASSRDRHGELLSISGIGEAVGASQIVYVEVSRFAETPDGITPRPTATCMVSVLDLNQKKRVFPTGSEMGQKAIPVTASLGEVDPMLLRSQSARTKLHQQLAREMGEEIAKLFYKHKVYDMGDRLNG